MMNPPTTRDPHTWPHVTGATPVLCNWRTTGVEIVAIAKIFDTRGLRLGRGPELSTGGTLGIPDDRASKPGVHIERSHGANRTPQDQGRLA